MKKKWILIVTLSVLILMSFAGCRAMRSASSAASGVVSQVESAGKALGSQVSGAVSGAGSAGKSLGSQAAGTASGIISGITSGA